jgi:hypothetical protein
VDELLKFLVKETIEIQKEIEADSMEDAENLYREMSFDELQEIIVSKMTEDEPHVQITEVK